MIRKLDINNETELKRVMTIWQEANIKAHDFIPKEYWISNYDIVKNEYIPNSDTYLYLKDDEIKGFISIVSEEYIGGLFVDINSQGNGIGKDLINYVKSKYSMLRLGVYKKNKRAVNFYDKMGFKIKSENIDEKTKEVECIMEFNK